MARKLTTEDVQSIRKMLLVGLASYGEIGRLSNREELAKMTGESVPEGMRPIHPTGDANTVCDFSDALRTLEQLEVAHD